LNWTVVGAAGLEPARPLLVNRF